MRNSAVKRVLYFLRNTVYREVLRTVKDYSTGRILDVGGGNFYMYVKGLGIDFDSYTIIDREPLCGEITPDSRIKFLQQDAEKMDFNDNYFDTVLCIHMLEHTLRPLEVISGIYRVLRCGGVAIFLVPQNSPPHDIPEHYYNFTRYFIQDVLRQHDFEIIKIQMLGGMFRTIASRIFHLPLFIFGDRLYRDKNLTRGVSFYLLLPLTIILSPLIFLISMILSLGDIEEDANNILVIARKRQ